MLVTEIPPLVALFEVDSFVDVIFNSLTIFISQFSLRDQEGWLEDYFRK